MHRHGTQNGDVGEAGTRPLTVESHAAGLVERDESVLIFGDLQQSRVRGHGPHPIEHL